MLFTYSAKNAAGLVVEGKREAADRLTLARDLRGEGVTLLVAREKKSFDLSVLNHIFVRITLHERVIFTRNLAAMLLAGIALSRALGILERQTQNFKFKRVLNSLLDDVNRGLSLSEGMKKFPKVFSSLFTSMVKAGEESGGLPGALRIIGTQLEKSYAMRKKIRGAMIYPAVVLVAIFAIGTLMLIYVVPTLTATFKDMHAELPKSTQLIILISNLLIAHTVSFFLSLAALIAGVVALVRTARGARTYDYLLIHLPIFGELVKEVNAARTSRTLASLLVAGVDVRQSLLITRDVLQNVFYKDVLDKAEVDVEKGLPLSGLFKAHQELYPVMVGEMMEVGEETGKLSEMLENIASFYEDEVETATKDLSMIIEPLLMIVIGAAVGFFAVSIISPTYSLLNNI